MSTLKAPAKLNLTLEVLGKRPDGYHEIRSVIQTIALCDLLHFEYDSKLTIASNLPGWSSDKSLVAKAVNLLRKTTSTNKGAGITITKNIPLVSGLGGDSSDAAATLQALNEQWGLGLTRSNLADLAAQLGSDVPFFLYGGTALMSGRGEVITPLPSLPHRYFILAQPDIPLPADKTKRLYASLDPKYDTKGEATDKLVTALRGEGSFNPSLLFNVFENTAFNIFPDLLDYRNVMLNAGAELVHLAGSGPTLYVMLEKQPEAATLFRALQKKGLKSFLTESLPSG